MKTVTTTKTIYEFSELSEDAKQTALNEYRQTNDDDFFRTELVESIKKLIDLFGLKSGREWCDLSTSHMDDCILELKGLRLRTYLINNYWGDLYKGKYYSLWSKTEKSFKHYKEGYPVLKSRHSKVMFDNCCVLTGVCFDDDILAPIYDFFASPKNDTTFADLIGEIENAISGAFRSNEEWVNSDEYITDVFEANQYEFDEDGSRA